MDKKFIIAINFIKEHFFTFFTFFIIFILFYANTSAGERVSSLCQILCGAFVQFDMIMGERFCRP